MYYSHPESDEAYLVPDQYWFGSELICAPIVSKADPVVNAGHVRVWLPEGTWTDFFRGDVYTGGQIVDVYRAIDEIPVFCKGGAIVPLQIKGAGDNSQGHATEMEVLVFPGANNSFTMYEDEGEGQNYKNGVFARTKFEYSEGQKPEFTINMPAGDKSVLPKTRKWTVVFRGVKPSVSSEISLNGKETAPESVKYDTKTNSLSVTLAPLPIDSEIRFTLADENGVIYDGENIDVRTEEILRRAVIQTYLKSRIQHDIVRANITREEKLMLLSLPSTAGRMDVADDGVLAAVKEVVGLYKTTMEYQRKRI
jgi:hypothetical protein